MNKEFNKGLTLIEVLVGTFLVLIVFSGIFGAYQLGLKVIGQSRNKITAMIIADGELEQVRNLSYGSIGVAGGFPSGVLESLKNKTVNGVEYIIKTRVDYVVDEADGLSSPSDECPNDYKKVEVEVSWLGALSGNVKLLMDIAPETLAQECAEEGGILLVRVFDAYGIMTPSPLIEIKDPATGETIKTAIPGDGAYFFSLQPAIYRVEVSKPGFNSARTFSIDEIANPEKPNPIVLDGQLTEISFSIDELSVFQAEAVGPEALDYPPIPNARFNLKGDKIIGLDAEENPIPKYYENHIANESGQITISGLEWDSYVFTPDGLDLISIESPAGLEAEQPLGLDPGATQEVRLILSGENSLLLNVQDAETSEPIFSAECRLYNDFTEYDITQYTGENGKTYYIPLDSISYNLEISLTGYDDYFGSAYILGDQIKTINLNRIE